MKTLRYRSKKGKSENMFLETKRLILLIRIIISGIILAYLFSGINIAEVQSMFSAFEFIYLLAATLLVFFQIIIASERWHKVLFGLGVNLTFKNSIKIHWSGLFLNIALPGTVGGDAYRILKIRDFGASYSKGLASIVLDQFLLIIVSTFVSFIFFLNLHASIRAPYFWSLYFVVGSLLIIFFVLIISEQTLAKKYSTKLYQNILGFLHSLKQVITDFKVISKVIALQLISVLLICMTIKLLFLAGNSNVPFYYLIAFMPPIFIFSQLPITIGGWGIRELAMITSFSLININKELAFSVSLIFGFLNLTSAFFGILFYLDLKKS